jgi:hypothetical protein
MDAIMPLRLEELIDGGLQYVIGNECERVIYHLMG